MIVEEAYLEHFGIKGMKWGKRKRSGPNPAYARVRANTDAARAERFEISTGHKAVTRGDKLKRDLDLPGLKANKGKIAGVVALTATLAVGKIALKSVLGKRGSKAVTELPMPFRASGKDWLIEARDGRVFDIAMAEMSKQRMGI